MKAAGYVRYSPRPEVGYTEEMQLEGIRKLCELKGWELAKVFTDRKKTGKKLERREGLDLLLREVRGGGYGAVVVYKVDRLARNLRDLLNLLHDLGERGVTFAASNIQDIDPTNPYGKALLQMIGVFAELEGGLISERTKEGLAEARDLGVKIGRPAFGFTRLGALDPLGAKAREILNSRPEIRLADLAEELSTVQRAISVKQAWQLKKNLRRATLE